MSASGIAPLTRRIGVASAGYVAVWALLRILLGGSTPPQWLALALLVGAFALAAAGRGRLGLVRSVAVMVMVVAAVLTAIESRAGSLEVSDAWSTAGMCCIALLVIGRGRAVVAAATVAVALTGVGLLAGAIGLADVGAPACVLLVAVVAAADRALDWYAGQLQEYGDTEHEAIEWRAAQDAYQVAHQERIGQTARLAEGMLRRIVEAGGRLDHEHRVECRLLHQAIRDETRGRRLLNDAVREQVMQHRRRGAVVQLLDDGDLDDLDGDVLAGLLDRVAESLAPLRSDRLIIRSAARDSEVAITVVATSSDPIAAALGMDDDEQVDLWLELPRPLLAAAR